MARVDPGGVAMRALHMLPLRRRLYSVPGPNHLWHIDGYHKLVHWKIIIHGGIDGYSRCITFLSASDNNRAATVHDLFVQSTKKFGIPSRVRTDRGVENVDVAALMLHHRGEGRGSIIQGTSVHNQRIERSWVDLWKDVINVYYCLFYSMGKTVEEGGMGIFDIHNETHMWALHYIFLPRINRSLDEFTEQRNNQGLRTERGKSPKRIFMLGMLNMYHEDHAAVQDFWEGRELVPPAHLPVQRHRADPVSHFTHEQLQIIQSVDPLSGPQTAEAGKDLYLQLLSLL
ncbi:uncharacterized protein [Littorina saxatilis]